MINKVIVVGIGHPFRGDDALGPEVVSLLQKRLPKSVQLKAILGDIAELLSIFEEFTHVYIVDAVYSQRVPPGTPFRVDGSKIKDVSKHCRTSTHAFDISQAIELATNLGLLPHKLVIYGIEGENFEHGNYLSSSVCAQVEKLCDELYNELFNEPGVKDA